jgi:cysteine desulfurase
MKTPIYFDNAATTPIRGEVIKIMSDVMKNNYGNASSSHSFGRSSKSLIEKYRKDIAAYFEVSPSEIIFTSGGTEADNLVLQSAARDLGIKTFITSKTEHHAVLHTLDQLKKEYGVLVLYVNLDENGEVDYSHLEKLLQSHSKVLVSLMHVNNEIGNLLDIKQVAVLCKKHNALFHSDTVQSVGHYPINLSDISIDFLAASAHKFHGPKGVGFCFIRKNSGLQPLMFGGEQERGYRAGTESVHNIAGLAEALRLAYENLNVESAYVKDIKTYFINTLQTAIPGVSFNGNSGDLEKSTYTSVNVCFPVAPDKGALFLFQLDLKGIACSKGSACQSGSSQNSHVLSEILSHDELLRPSIRFSFSIYNTKEEVDYVVNSLKELVTI